MRKKSKILLATMAAAAFATSAGALVACGDAVELPGDKTGGVVEITFNANGGLFEGDVTTIKVETDANGLIATQPKAPTLDGYKFNGYYVSATDANSVKITYGANGYEFKSAITVYAQWTKIQQAPPVDEKKECTVTFNGGEHGTITGETTATTKNGLLEAFPAVEAAKGWKHIGWMLQDKTPVTLETSFTQETVTVYANYEAVQPEDPPEEDDEFDITFDAGDHGTLVGSTTVKTVDGKATFPTVNPDSGWIHTGWQLADETPIDDDWTFIENETVTAVYDVDPISTAAAIICIGDRQIAMVDNSESIEAQAKANGQDIEYMLAGLELSANDTVTFKLRDGNDFSATPVQFYLDGESLGVDITVTDEKITTVTALSTATYKLYLKHWTKDLFNQPCDNWTVYATDGSTPVVETFEDGYYLIGKMTNWNLNSAYFMEDNTWEGELTAGIPFKVGGCEDGVKTWNSYELNWYQLDAASQAIVDVLEKDTNNNVAVKVDGTYIITITSSNTWSITKKGGSVVITPDPGDDENEKADGLYIGDTLVGSLVKNTGGCSATRNEYWFGSGQKKDLTTGNKVQIWMNGKQLTLFVEENSSGVEKPSTAVNEVDVTATGGYMIYLHDNLNNDGTHKNWSAQFVAPTNIGSSSEIPNGTPFTITVKGANNTTKSVTIYLKNASGDVTNLSAYQIWGWSSGGTNFYDDWNTRPTLTESVNIDKVINDNTISIKLTWSGSDSGDINELQFNKTYVITLSNGSASVAELTVA